MVKKLYISLRGKLYFTPGVYAIVFSILAILFLNLDRFYNKELTALLPSFLFTPRSLGSMIFSMEVGSLLTMLTITFSTMMVVLTIYGTQLSPRTLQDFLEKRTTLSIMGYFIGALSFSILSLFFIKPQQYDTYVLSPAVGILILAVAVIVFAYFIHYISKSIQVTIYIQNLVKETSGLIEKKQRLTEFAPEVNNETLDRFSEIREEECLEIAADKSGFIQLYDEKKLFEFSKENNIIIWCEKMVGEHILEDDTLLKIYSPGNLKDREAAAGKLREMVYIGGEPNLYEDMGAGTKKLVEIAVRALSPGINDPGTAVFCIEMIGFLLQKVAKGLEARIYTDEDRKVKLIVQGLTFERLLYDHFYQIKHYGIQDLAILDAILGALITISKDNGYFIKKQAWDFSQYLISGINIKDYPKIEQTYIRERFYQLAKATQQKRNLNELFTDKAANSNK